MLNPDKQEARPVWGAFFKMERSAIKTAIGWFTLEYDAEGVCRAEFCAEMPEITAPMPEEEAWRTYFAGRGEPPQMKLNIKGTSFCRAVWDAARAVGYGQSVSYGQLARAIGMPRAARAVGQALGKNPVLVLIPCHRVTAKGGLGGFSAGAEIKRFLRRTEGADCPAEAEK